MRARRVVTVVVGLVLMAYYVLQLLVLRISSSLSPRIEFDPIWRLFGPATLLIGLVGFGWLGGSRRARWAAAVALLPSIALLAAYDGPYLSMPAVGFAALAAIQAALVVPAVWAGRALVAETKPMDIAYVVVVAASVVVSLASDPSPPRPTTSRIPDAIGVLVAAEASGQCGGQRMRLDSGAVLEVAPSAQNCGSGAPRQTATPRLSETELRLGSESVATDNLVLYGEDELGAFYAVANASRDPVCQWELHGPAYDAGRHIHLSSGLMLEKSGSFSFEPRRIEDQFPLEAGDDICLNGSGQVEMVSRFTRY